MIPASAKVYMDLETVGLADKLAARVRMADHYADMREYLTTPLTYAAFCKGHQVGYTAALERINAWDTTTPVKSPPGPHNFVTFEFTAKPCLPAFEYTKMKFANVEAFPAPPPSLLTMYSEYLGQGATYAEYGTYIHHALEQMNSRRLRPQAMDVLQGYVYRKDERDTEKFTPGRRHVPIELKNPYTETTFWKEAR